MHTARISKTFTFAAAHQLPNHKGKCAQLHGHTYRVDVLAGGRVNDERGESDDGMVVDFDTITSAWATIEPLLDHRNLNDTVGGARLVPPRTWPTTAENIALWILHALNHQVPHVHGVRVWESSTSWAEVTTGDDREWEWRYP